MITSRRKNSGQVLIIASLTLTMLLLATALYVVNLQKNNMQYVSTNDLDLPRYKQGLRNTLISSLVNVTNEGNVDILATNLEDFNNFVSERSYGAFLDEEHILRSDGSYQNGIWISQNSSGTAVASAYVSFDINASTATGTFNTQFDINVISMIETSGDYVTVNGTEKQAILTCELYNENLPALADSFTVSYSNDNMNWIKINSLGIVDSGLGIYTITFDANDLLDTAKVFLSCQDERGIIIQTLVPIP